MKAYNITDKRQQRSLFLDSIGEATLDIFEQLDDTETYLDGAITALLNKFKESQNRLFNIHKFRCTIQGKDETWDSFIARLKAEGEHCDFPAGWLDAEILMAMITNGKSRRESTCTLQEVNPVEQSHNRPLKTVLISGVDITVLPDSGATVNAMDEAMFKKYGLEKRLKVSQDAK